MRNLLVALAAGVAFEVQVSPERLEWPLARDGEVTVTVDTFEQDQVIGIRPLGPKWPDGGVAGGPLAYGRPVVEGPGTARGFASSGFVRLPIGCERGAMAPTAGVALRAPARSRTVLRYPVRLAAPPWVGTDYAPSFSTAFPFEEGVTNPTSLTVRGPAFQVGGRTGVRTVLTSRPARRKGHSYLKVRRSRGLTIVGRTEPPLANRSLRLTYKRMTRGPVPAEGRVATVRTDRHGRFAYRWRPRSLGLYAVAAHYDAAADEPVVSDTSCGLIFNVTR